MKLISTELPQKQQKTPKTKQKNKQAKKTKQTKNLKPKTNKMHTYKAISLPASSASFDIIFNSFLRGENKIHSG